VVSILFLLPSICVLSGLDFAFSYFLLGLWPVVIGVFCTIQGCRIFINFVGTVFGGLLWVCLWGYCLFWWWY